MVGVGAGVGMGVGEGVLGARMDPTIIFSSLTRAHKADAPSISLFFLIFFKFVITEFIHGG